MRTLTTRQQRELVDAATRCEQGAARYGGDTPGPRRAREILTSTAGYCRAAADQLTADPTLAGEPPGSDRLRAPDLLCELARMTLGWVDSAVRDPRPPRQGWADVEDLHERLVRCAAQVPRSIRDDHATVTGSRDISLARLVAGQQRLRHAAEAVRDAIAGALLLSHPHPVARELVELADRIQDKADGLTKTASVGAEAARDAAAVDRDPPATVETAAAVNAPRTGQAPGSRGLVVWRGLPGSGKTTAAQARLGRSRAAGVPTARLGRDSVRAVLGLVPGATTRDEEDQVTAAQHAMIRALWAAGVRVVLVDDTNLTDEPLAALADLARDHGAALEVADLRHVPLAGCVARDATRTGVPHVGAERITAMHETMTIPG